jgi:hypothetical protein
MRERTHEDAIRGHRGLIDRPREVGNKPEKPVLPDAARRKGSGSTEGGANALNHRVLGQIEQFARVEEFAAALCADANEHMSLLRMLDLNQNAAIARACQSAERLCARGFCRLVEKGPTSTWLAAFMLISTSSS